MKSVITTPDYTLYREVVAADSGPYETKNHGANFGEYEVGQVQVLPGAGDEVTARVLFWSEAAESFIRASPDLVFGPFEEAAEFSFRVNGRIAFVELTGTVSDAQVYIAAGPLGSEVPFDFDAEGGAELSATLTDAIDTKASKRLVARVVSGTSGTLAQSDEDTGVIATNAAATSIEAPQLAAGTVIAVMQGGLGQVQIVPGAGVTIPQAEDKTVDQYKTIVLWWRSTTEVWVSGEAEA
jgi:hypothetical protein